jgi:hypothetical protein
MRLSGVLKGGATRNVEIVARKVAAGEKAQGDSRYDGQRDTMCAVGVVSGGSSMSRVPSRRTRREGDGIARRTRRRKEGEESRRLGSRKVESGTNEMGKGWKEDRREEKGRAARKGEGKEGDSRSGRRRRRRKLRRA